MPKLVLRLKLQLGLISENDGVHKNPLNILITGITGFLGRNLIGSLHPHRIIGLGTRDETIEGIPVFSVGNLDKISPSPDILIVGHAAVAAGSQHVPNSVLYEVNVALTEKILDTFKDAFVIYISTASVYDNRLPPSRKTRRLPHNRPTQFRNCGPRGWSTGGPMPRSSDFPPCLGMG